MLEISCFIDNACQVRFYILDLKSKIKFFIDIFFRSVINPFDSQEAKPFRNDPEIVAMNRLVSAYQNSDIHEFEEILESNRESIMADPFIREHIEELLANIRSKVDLLSILLCLIFHYECLDLSKYQRYFYYQNINKSYKNYLFFQVLLSLTKPFTRVRLSYLAQKLHINIDELVKLLVELILDGTLNCKIDEINGILIANSADDERFEFEPFFCYYGRY